MVAMNGPTNASGAKGEFMPPIITYLVSSASSVFSGNVSVMCQKAYRPIFMWEMQFAIMLYWLSFRPHPVANQLFYFLHHRFFPCVFIAKQGGVFFLGAKHMIHVFNNMNRSFA